MKFPKKESRAVLFLDVPTGRVGLAGKRSDCGSDCRDLLEWEQQDNYLVNCFRSKRSIFRKKVEGLKCRNRKISVDEQRPCFEHVRNDSPPP